MLDTHCAGVAGWKWQKATKKEIRVTFPLRIQGPRCITFTGLAQKALATTTSWPEPRMLLCMHVWRRNLLFHFAASVSWRRDLKKNIWIMTKCKGWFAREVSRASHMMLLFERIHGWRRRGYLMPCRTRTRVLLFYHSSFLDERDPENAQSLPLFLPGVRSLLLNSYVLPSQGQNSDNRVFWYGAATAPIPSYIFWFRWAFKLVASWRKFSSREERASSSRVTSKLLHALSMSCVPIQSKDITAQDLYKFKETVLSNTWA
jgi:hypothetical protein